MVFRDPNVTRANKQLFKLRPSHFFERRPHRRHGYCESASPSDYRVSSPLHPSLVDVQQGFRAGMHTQLHRSQPHSDGCQLCDRQVSTSQCIGPSIYTTKCRRHVLLLYLAMASRSCATRPTSSRAEKVLRQTLQVGATAAVTT